MATMFQQDRLNVGEGRGYVGRTKAGKLSPIMGVPVGQSEFGMLMQSVSVELDPIPGRLLTQIMARVTAVFVPYQAMHALKNAASSTAGLTEVIRQEMLTGAPVFALEAEGEISKRCNIQPIKIAGVKMTNEVTRLAHACAVNFLRQALYVKATLVDKTLATVTPALLSSTALERIGGVLDPDTHINGKVNIALPTMQLPVKNLHVAQNSGAFTEKPVNDDGTLGAAVASTTRALHAKESATAGQIEKIYALFSGATSLSAVDFYNAKKMDEMTRIFREIVDADPQNGENQILRLCYGLSLDNDRMPFVLASREVQLNGNIVNAMDTAGVQNETRRSDVGSHIEFAVPVPRTELGGYIVTFLEIKPEEKLNAQPHPRLSAPWGAENFAATELDLDPVPVLMRDLDANVATGSETTVAMWTGKNEIKRRYVDFGLSPQLDPATIDGKTVMWTYPIPLSVTPDNILYPASLSQAIFANTAAEVCTYFVQSNSSFRSPMIVGPSPVEKLATIVSNDLFDEVV